MRILLDESVPVQVRKAFHQEHISTVTEMGWRGLSNGKLLQEVQRAGFDLFIVADKNIRFQQNLDSLTFAILELWTNHRPTLEVNLHYIAVHAKLLKPGQFHSLPPP